ncbi:signal peptidase I [Marininema mesophilum]|uniref:Signal peptidase I n=1 Tax=Marininema mesophilum TaxID=1048340 RepID=A0A1H2X387_9BACL|nr:signal peptidase I [Marininema mesophilum]SDW87342.1 signal peptidase I [Marininema mesophilum]
MKKIITISLSVCIVMIICIFIFFQYFFFYEVDGYSMSPTLTNHESVLSREFALKDIDRGDIIGFQHPTIIGAEYIKRVVGLPNDQIEIRRGQVFINRKKFNFPINGKGSSNFGPITVEKNHVFVLGDHLAGSRDSREFGTVTYKQIRGVLVFK